MKRKTQWIAIALLTGTAGLTPVWADSHRGACDGVAFEGERWDGQGQVITERRMVTTSSRPAWVVKEEALRQPRRTGFVVVEPARSERVLLRETSPVVSREEIVLEPVAERTGEPMRHVIIRERLAPVAEGPLHTGPATIKERRYIKRTVYKKARPEFKRKTTRVYRRAGDSLEAVGERTKYTVKRTAKRTGHFLSDVAHRTGESLERFGRTIIGEPEPVAERTIVVEPIYERDDQLRDTGWYDVNNPYR